jgi:hypothetical protein
MQSHDNHDVELDLPRVSKLNWKTAPIRDAWKQPLASFVDARQTVAKAAVQDPDHPRRLLRRRLPADAVSSFRSELSDRVEVAVETDEEGATVGITSADCPLDPEVVVDQQVGPLDALHQRGVPECCAEAYQQHRANGQEDPVAAIARSSESTVERGGEYVVDDPHPILNVMWAFRGWSFVDFYPCSFECDAARAVATETGRVFREEGYGDVAEAAFEFLDTPTYWSGYHGLAHVKSGWCIGEYTTDDYWTEQTVRFNGYHQDRNDPDEIEHDAR